MSSFSHLAVGTEITVGQILNTSSQWLSQKCERLGLNCQFHLSVADQRDDLEKAARFLSTQSHVIFVTGGLGPTVDDFTRDIIAKVTHQKLEWSELAWSHLKSYIAKRQSIVRESHKQECFFPPGSTLFLNPIGTACGFAFKTDTTTWVVLPGPPREIEAMWQSQIEPYLMGNITSLNLMTTWSTYIFGLPESSVAELLTPLLDGCPYEVGYRIHLPYIEFKLRFPETQRELAKPWIEKVESQFVNQKTVPSLTYLPERIWTHLETQLGSLPERLLILNPQGHEEVTRRFQVTHHNQQRVQVIDLPHEQLQITEPYLAIEWNLELEPFCLWIEILQGSCVPLKTLKVESPLNSNYSAERRKKDLIERALFELSSTIL